MSGVKELNGFYGPSFSASDINFFLGLATFPVCSSFQQMCHGFGFSKILGSPLSPRFHFHASHKGHLQLLPLYGLSLRDSPATCYLASVALRNHRTRIHGPFTLPSFTTLNPTPRVNIAKSPLPAWDEPSLSWMTVAAVSVHSFFLGQKALCASCFPKLEAYLGGALRGASLTIKTSLPAQDSKLPSAPFPSPICTLCCLLLRLLFFMVGVTRSSHQHLVS